MSLEQRQGLVEQLEKDITGVFGTETGAGAGRTAGERHHICLWNSDRGW